MSPRLPVEYGSAANLYPTLIIDENLWSEILYKDTEILIKRYSLFYYWTSIND